MLRTTLIGGLALAGWMLAGAGGTACAEGSDPLERVADTALRAVEPVAERPLERAGEVLDQASADVRGGPAEQIAELDRTVLDPSSTALTETVRGALAPLGKADPAGPPAGADGGAPAPDLGEVPGPVRRDARRTAAEPDRVPTVPASVRPARRAGTAEPGAARVKVGAPVVPIHVPELPGDRDDGDGAYVQGGQGPLLGGPVQTAPLPAPPRAPGSAVTRYSYRNDVSAPADPTVTPD